MRPLKKLGRAIKKVLVGIWDFIGAVFDIIEGPH